MTDKLFNFSDLKPVPPLPETREEMIARWEKEGWLDPNCAGCKEIYDFVGRPCDVMAPGHKANDRCDSGKRAHCSCDICF